MNCWTQNAVKNGGGWEFAGGMLGLNGETQISKNPYINDKLVLTAQPTMRDLHVAFEFLTTDSDLIGVGLCSNDTKPDGFYLGITQDRWFDVDDGPIRIGYWKNASDNASSEVSYNENLWHEVIHAWTSSSIQSTFSGGFFQWNSGPKSANSFCFASNAFSSVYFDNLMIRLYVNPEPVLAPGTEQNLP